MSESAGSRQRIFWVVSGAVVIGLVGLVSSQFLPTSRVSAQSAKDGSASPSASSQSTNQPVVGARVSAAIVGSAAPSNSASSTPASAVVSSGNLARLIDETPGTLAAQREILFQNMKSQLMLSDEVMDKTKAIFSKSDWMGQGNPKVTEHPMTRTQCVEARSKSPLKSGDSRCGAPNMVPVFDPGAGETAQTAKLCVDQFEYPNIPCEYPVTWVRSDEAHYLCQAQGKRLCDAHEWEGSCAGAVHAPEQEYTFGERRIMQEYLHNKTREIVWAYGTTKNHGLCGTDSKKSNGCIAPTWEKCGSNTYPAGAFEQCVSSFGVYDQHGNAAEHMNLPLLVEELGSKGGTGDNEMKGSWFIFRKASVHEDDCRWRALGWHAGRLLEKNAHRNYHLGFRCCKDLQ